MKGKTNSQTGGFRGERINILLVTNQTSHDDVKGAVISIAYEDVVDRYTYRGNMLTANVPPYVYYTVSVSDVDGYAAPAAVNATAVPGNSRSVTMKYNTEVLTVNVSSDIGLPSSYTVTVGGIGSQTTAEKVYKVPFGRDYTVSATSAYGYETPAQQSFTASQASRSVQVAYMEDVDPRGVFIQGSDGILYTDSQWNGREYPNGIAVITDNCRFVMALENAHAVCKWSSQQSLVSGVSDAASMTEAAADYNGMRSTSAAVQTLAPGGDLDFAAYYCSIYRFPSSDMGYMGGAGEWQAVIDNKEAVDAALAKCGGTALNYAYWTSTQYGPNSCWVANFNAHGLVTNAKPASFHVRAFCVLY